MGLVVVQPMLISPHGKAVDHEMFRAIFRLLAARVMSLAHLSWNKQPNAAILARNDASYRIA